MNARQKWPDTRELPAYAVGDAALYLQLSPSTLRAWTFGQDDFQPVIQLPEGAQRLSFVNLVEAHVLKAIRRHHGVPLRAIRRALDYVRKELGVERPLANQQFETDGVSLFVSHLGQLLNASRGGQIAMADIVRAYLRRIQRDAKGIPIRLFPMTRSTDDLEQPNVVAIDPAVAFGRPTIARSGVPTDTIADRYKAGDTVEILMDDYRLTREEIDEAIRCELGYRRAA